ncbi:MAG: class I SAM-dependent methyltransferase [bacterium]
MHDARAEMLANRLIKVARHRRKWARRADVACYRLYDRDIPEIPLIIDWYDGRLYVAEYVRGEPLADLDALADAAAVALGLGPDDVWCRQRERQRGTRQYDRVGEDGAWFVVPEGGLKFRVNLSDYLDTGLFLDHRQTRARVRAEAGGKRVLNLFAYTGSFTVYAAAGGARASVTVDLSRTYLDWAGQNLALNALDLPEHVGVQADARVWLAEARDRRERFDLIVLDPPTFSNSKRMDGTLDVQRDHRALVEDALGILSPGGALYFSTNHRRFQPDWAGLGVEVSEITGETVPPDFDRHRPHRCFRLVRP